ncbi:hypothetical protein H0H81_012184, partial [Sphagnurus paluster]
NEEAYTSDQTENFEDPPENPEGVEDEPEPIQEDEPEPAPEPEPESEEDTEEMAARPTELKMAAPTVFDGNRSQTNQFISEIVLYLGVNDDVYNMLGRRFVTRTY